MSGNLIPGATFAVSKGGEIIYSEGLLSNAEYLVKFRNAMLFSGYFKEVISDDFFEPVLLYNNMPSVMKNEWMLLTDNQNHTIYGKTGSVTVGSSEILVYPEEELIVAFATNLVNATNNSSLFKIANHFLPEEEHE